MKASFLLIFLFITISCSHQQSRSMASLEETENDSLYKAFETPTSDPNSLQAKIFFLIQKEYANYRVTLGPEFTKSVAHEWYVGESYDVNDHEGKKGLTCNYFKKMYQCQVPENNRTIDGKQPAIYVLRYTYHTPNSLYELLPDVVKKGNKVMKSMSDGSIRIICSKVVLSWATEEERCYIANP